MGETGFVGVLRCAQDDSEKQATATAKSRQLQLQRQKQVLHFVQDDKLIGYDYDGHALTNLFSDLLPKSILGAV